MSGPMIEGPHGEFPSVIYHESNGGGVWRVEFTEDGLDINPPIDAEQEPEPYRMTHHHGLIELRES